MSKAAKPGLMELVGVAVNTSALEFSVGQERALDRVAGLGAAAARISIGADAQHLPIAAMRVDVYRRAADMRQVMLNPGVPDERDIIAGELCPLLVHIREGGQHENLPQAIRLFARWMRLQRSFAELAADIHLPLLERFGAWAIHEWLSPVCARCGGSGKLERTRGGSWIRPRGAMQRNAVFRECVGCLGSGRMRPSNTERARWLEMDRTRYEAEGWERRFTLARVYLERRLHRRVHRPLTVELERSTKRS